MKPLNTVKRCAIIGRVVRYHRRDKRSSVLLMSQLSRRICVGVVAAVAVLCVSAAVFTVARQASAGEAPATSSPPTVTETVLYSFCNQPDHSTGACLDGETPNGLIQGSDGNFYGTTGPYGDVSGGTMYKLTPSGTLTTLHSFCPQKDPNSGDCLDGYGPGGVIEGSDGNFYGTAGSGGANFERGGGSAGTAYMITPSGAFTTLYSFCAQVDPETENCLDGEQPDGIIEGSDGNFYGTTSSGGLNSFGGARPAGIVFKLTPSGVLTTLYSFCSQDPDGLDCLDGQEPSGLIEGSDGNFYGITAIGGQFGMATTSGGTVFKLTPSGTLTTLHSFCSEEDPSTGNCIDGDEPSDLIEGSDGNFYGTTSSGGANGDGSVFRLTPSGTLTTLYSFCSEGNPNTFSCPDGTDPSAVIEGSDGNFYGITRVGGEYGNYNRDGTAFMLTPSGTLTTLYSFCSQLDPSSTDCLDGALPNGFIQASDGNFYGTTDIGGANGDFGFGTLFKLAVYFPTPVRANLTISPGEHSFGMAKVGTTRHETFLVRASSRGNDTGQIVLGSFTITGGDYFVDQTMTTCKQGQMLQRNQECKIVVDFAPLMATKQMTDTGTLNVMSNAEEVHPKHGVVTLRGGGKASGKRR
ncbi:choice-of-anchor tandem repeat GloVer-containing protein [Candidatus Binatus sp.]|uniref:choice-of-anchor tandem repeat GloVer-containing protein n=1 Tax=Candidatus Binatus sp. TaxID=2811406 RepID=UPI003C610BD9